MSGVSLSPNEKRLLAHIAARRSTKDIAAMMGVGRSYVAQLRQDLRARGVLAWQGGAVPEHGRYTAETYPWVIQWDRIADRGWVAEIKKKETDPVGPSS